VNLRNISTLHWALGVSLVVHAVLLTVRFVDPESFNRIFEDTPLEVILVNASSNERPDKPQAMAQANLQGGGEAVKGRATSPLPPAPVASEGDASETSERKVESLKQQQAMLLSTVKEQLAALPQVDTKLSPNPEQMSSEERRKQLTRILAEIERRINEENARPKKRYISPSTQEADFALYYDGMRRKIEEKGTDNFPQLAGNKLYGDLTMLLTVNYDGKVLEAEVVQSSGKTALDKRAKAIAMSSGPFGRFNSSMRKSYEQLVLVANFRFTRDDGLEAKFLNPTEPLR
jgi:protein TonB